MKGVVVPAAGAAFNVVNNLEKPNPGRGEILVKSLVTGINPMFVFKCLTCHAAETLYSRENFMQSGLLIDKWPTVLGCDASGIVVELGEAVEKFKIGDYVFGCTKFGGSDYMTFQEYVCFANILIRF